jgi:hypothetical protein
MPYDQGPASGMLGHMALYYFHLRGRERIADNRGLDLPDDYEAQREAQRVASALQRARGDAWSVLVTNERGHRVTEIPGTSTISR